MFNYRNLCDYEFELLCKDIMQKKLGKTLHTFARGRDGGIDITDDTVSKNVVVQVKHYINSTYSSLLSSLKKEIPKVLELKPRDYYVCCAMELTAANKTEVFNLFSDYMKDSSNILSLNDIDSYLHQPDNVDILRRHYKLWLESTQILSEINNRDVFVDCEVLLSDIKELQKEFVETSIYRKCIDVLDHDNMLMILGMPGIGKTVTTKMLALYYAAQNYRIIYTTNGELSSIKKALSVDKDALELVLLDDCLGQYYFKMKENQENEIMSLIKYIAMHNNKKLIMNSRVTIFQQAKDSYIELQSYLEKDKLRIQYIDMESMTTEDKGRILKNHLYFRDIPLDYYKQILRDHNYRKIVNHRNYTPRIIDYVTRIGNYRNIAAEDYFEFINKCLENPEEIWSNEFNKRLQTEDRIFLTSLFSLTDISVEEKVLQRVFNTRIAGLTAIDTTRNIWSEVLKRMEGTFVRIIENSGRREIGVINPSVNDFLKNHLDSNELEVKEIKRLATEYRQIDKGFGPDMCDIVRAGRACSLGFKSEKEKQMVVLSYICDMNICMEQYKPLVHAFIEKLPYAFYKDNISTFTLLPTLLSGRLAEYYGVYDILSEDDFEDLMSCMELDDFCLLEKKLHECNLELGVLVNCDMLVTQLDRAVSDYIDSADREEYFMAYDDIYELFSCNMIYNGKFHEVDVDKVVEILAERVQEDIYDEVQDRLMPFPIALRSMIDVSSYDVDVSEREIDDYVHETLADQENAESEHYYYDMDSYAGKLDGMDELDFIFAE